MLYIKPDIYMMLECLSMAQETWVRSQVMLNTQHYKVWIKGKVEQSRERSSTCLV